MPVVNLVGCMASWHEAADPLLNMDINALAKAVSTSVSVISSAANLASEISAACTVTRKSQPAGGSRISTVIIPHDHTWKQDSSESPATPAALQAKQAKPAETITTNQPCNPQPRTLQPCNPQPAAVLFLTSCAKALKACPGGQSAIYCGGQALLRDHGSLVHLGRIAAATGATLICENAFPRVDRGAGLPHFQRLAYFPQEAAKELSRFSLMVAIDARLPVAMFGYKGGPSQLVTLPEDSIWQLDSSCIDIPWALQELAQQTAAESIIPGHNCHGVFATAGRPCIPSGKLTARSMCAVIAHVQPEDAIIVDESLTSGGAYWDLSKGCPRFSHLTLTGGAIGSGPPLAVGAAIACPDRPVINIQADGSAMYALQALWTQVREELQVVTIICANRTYAILKLELARQKIPHRGQATTSQALTDIGRPCIDWVLLAGGMGVQRAIKACTVEELATALNQALLCKGPTLIECLL
ncbi:TPA: hypothetical protein ACH3X2_009803 [Trebouxia sp. C0005]